MYLRIAWGRVEPGRWNDYATAYKEGAAALTGQRGLKALRAFDRAHDPPGVMRQLAAVAASGDGTERMGDVRVPTLVIHGREDLPDAELVIYDAIGHDLPRALWRDLIDRITRLCDRRRVG